MVLLQLEKFNISLAFATPDPRHKKDEAIKEREKKTEETKKWKEKRGSVFDGSMDEIGGFDLLPKKPK